MSNDQHEETSVFSFPVMMTMIALVCLVCYQAFGVNTAIATATAAVALVWCVSRRNDETPASEGG